MKRFFAFVFFVCVIGAVVVAWKVVHRPKPVAQGPLFREDVSLTIPEGWEIVHINEVLKPYNAVIPDLIPSELRSEYSFLKELPATASLEGFLFPDTYRVFPEDLPQALIKKQLDEFAERAPELMAEATKQKRTVLEIVTLASIIEKEVAKPADRAMVAGIFLNRLKIGMALQSDATVNYITRAGRARPTLTDLEVDSLYNTYKNPGLPPGPISNPGDSALQAAMHPQLNSYYYFLTDEEGNMYYARTFEEHQRNRQRAF